MSTTEINKTNGGDSKEVKEIDFEKVKKFIFDEMEHLNIYLHYHGRHHTFEDVLPMAEKFAQMEGLSEEEILIVKTAALFHDVGFLDQYEKNEPLGVIRARDILPSFGYNKEQLDLIEICIMATQMPQDPKGNKLAMCVCDADLSQCGTEKYFDRNERLRRELMQVKNINISPNSWHKGNIDFLKNVKFWTESARKTLNEGLKKNLKKTIKFVEEYESAINPIK